MSKKVNLNADIGESFGNYELGNDKAILDIINSANIACGYHAGDPLVMLQTVAMAADKGVSIGAHPSFPDLQGFGRRPMHIPLNEVKAMVMYQIGALMAIASSQNVEVTHVKPHGAMNNMASVDLNLANAIAEGMKEVSEDLVLLATAGSSLFEAGINAGIPTACEIFADRTYDENGNLTPRSEPGAIIRKPEDSAKQILSFLEAGGIIAPSGNVLKTDIHSICVHGDNSHAIEIASYVKSALGEAGYELTVLPETLN